MTDYITQFGKQGGYMFRLFCGCKRFLSDYTVPACPKYISEKLRSFSKNFLKKFFIPKCSPESSETFLLISSSRNFPLKCRKNRKTLSFYIARFWPGAGQWQLGVYGPGRSRLVVEYTRGNIWRVLRFCGFSEKSHFLEQILMEHIDVKNSLNSKLKICSMCFIRTRSGKWDIIKKLWTWVVFREYLDF